MKKTILFFIAVIISVTSYGQNWTELIKLEASDQQIDDNLGSSVAISGNYAIAGASREGSFGLPPNDAGAAYIFHFNSTTSQWTEVAKLVAADRGTSDFFGISVDISGTYAVVGAVQEDAARGAAYVFEKNGSDIWVQVAKLTATNTQANDRFGVSVAIDGSTIVVGAEHEDEDVANGNTVQNAGSAYIFTRSGGGTWSFSQKIVASDRKANSSFGNSVGIDGNKIIVGAYRNENTSFVEVGAAYVFTLSGSWTQTKKLTSSFITTVDRFGWSVDVSGSNYIVGAPFYDLDDSDADFKNNAGAAFFFDESNAWAEDRVVEGDRHDQDNLGIDVAISGTRAVVGAHLQNYDVNGAAPNLSDGGAAFVYERDGGSGLWNQTQKLLATDRFAGDKFGYAVDLTTTAIISGAVEDNSSSNGIASTGALYIFNDTTLGVDDDKINPALRLFPNPVVSDFTIDLRKNYAEVQMWVYNMLGQAVNRKTFTNTNLLESNINGSAGVYFVKIIASDNEQTTLKVVKR